MQKTSAINYDRVLPNFSLIELLRLQNLALLTKREVSKFPPFSIAKENVEPIIIIIIIIKKDWQCKAWRERLTPYQSEDPSPTLLTYRGKEEKGKIVEDKKGEST